MSLQLKAAFLLIVFSLNLIIGFACAAGIAMWFNTMHHEETELIAHQGSHHREADEHHESKSSKDSCCNKHVIKFSQVDKSLPQRFGGLHAIFFTTLISSHYNIDALRTFKSIVNTRYFIQGHHPPIPDIRIGVQSFQI